MQLLGSTLASRNCCTLSALASSMTPSRARPRPLGGVEFYGCCEQHLAQRTAPRYAWFRAAQEGLLDLHIAGEPVPSWAHHDRPVAVQHRPGALIRAELHLALQLSRADAALPAGQVPGRGEPDRQRRPGAVEDRARGGRDPPVAARATPATVRSPPPLRRGAPRAHEPLRPAQPVQIVQALPVLVEPGTQLCVGVRVVLTLSLIHISEPTRLGMTSYAVFCLKKKKN